MNVIIRAVNEIETSTNKNDIFFVNTTEEQI